MGIRWREKYENKISRKKKENFREDKNVNSSLNRIVDDSRSIGSLLSGDLIMSDRLQNLSKLKQFEKNASRQYIQATIQPIESTDIDNDDDNSPLFYVTEKHSELNSARNEIN